MDTHISRDMRIFCLGMNPKSTGYFVSYASAPPFHLQIHKIRGFASDGEGSDLRIHSAVDLRIHNAVESTGCQMLPKVTQLEPRLAVAVMLFLR